MATATGGGGTPLELKGADYFADTNPHSGRWWKFIVITAATFTTMTVGNWNTGITAVAIPAGTELVGYFTTLTLTSGSILAYRL